jgi:predicted CoA-substrate-specific enzyme activase
MPFFLGVDVGSTTVKVVLTDDHDDLLDHAYVRAHGQPAQVLERTLQALARRWDLGQVGGLGLTGSGGGSLAPVLGGLHVNELVAQTQALDLLAPYARTVIEMGGQDSKLLILEPDPENGHTSLADFAMNTLCAAGTGSFLEQQAERLGISLEEFAALALQSRNPARIAGRCTVFAKSDMIHLQQRGVPLPDIVAGLCLAVARNLRSTIGRGKPFRRPILLQGGVARNGGMVRAFEQVLGLAPGELIVPPHCTLMAALGAARTARLQTEALPPFRGLAPLAELLQNPRERPAPLPPLRPCPQRKDAETAAQPAGTPPGPGYLGVDVGSISTKVALLDEQGRLVAGHYLYTAGQPLEAVREALQQVAAQVGEVPVLGVGVTGSGRYLVGDYVGADLVRNEISAQARAALAFDPAVDTIFEIGGQDSKYIQLRDGVVIDFTMNKACAAGTGSFLEEQAQRLHLLIAGFGALALSSTAPADMGERCTVFMESDLVHHQQQGARREDLVAGLSYSIAQNYLNRVVHDRPIGQRILFQGGVAANPAVVAALAQLLGRPVVVPPHHDISGAIGAALLVLEERARQPAGKRPSTRFKGFDFSQRTYRSATFECQGCPNHCEVQRVTVAGERPAFYGARCERYEKGPARIDPHRPAGPAQALPDLFAEREELLLRSYREQPPAPVRPRIGFPRVLAFYDLLPFWCRLFQELGWEVVLSSPTTPGIAAQSAEGAGAETCFPVKVVYGHVLSLLEQGVERIFFPSLVNRAEPLPEQRQNYQCPFVQAAPHLVDAALQLAGRPASLWQLPLHFLWEEVLALEKEALTRQFGVSRGEFRRAWAAAEEEQRRFQVACRRRGQEVLDGLDAASCGAVLVGRAYNTADPGLNAGLPLKLRQLGLLALPIDFLPLDGLDIGDLCANMFWHSGQRILAAARLIQRDPRLQAIYVTNFGCGPDSFLLTYFQEAMRGKPFLELEIDDHSADAGLVTRCEAFFDSLEMRRERKASVPGGTGPVVLEERRPPSRQEHRPGGNGAGPRTAYLPAMCDHAHTLAAAMRYHGIPAEVLPPPDEETLAIGRSLCLGRECLPCFTSLGDIVRRARQPGFDPPAATYFMPTTGGPCRFGQYHFLQRQILDRLGLQEMEILSPTAENSYQGFGERPVQLRRLAWQGIVGVDLLEKLLHEHRPYEQVAGSTDELYRELLGKLVRAIEAGGGRRAVAVMEEAGRRFARLPVGGRDGRPVIGLVGEIYIRANPFTNQEIVRRVERLGGEVWVASMMEWFYFVNHSVRLLTQATRRYADLVKVVLVDQVQRWDEQRMLRPVAARLRNAHEPPIACLAGFARPYYDPLLGTEAVLSVGKAVEFSRQGLAGILNVLPFTCMPGTIVSGLSQRIRADHRQIPWLDVIYDAQGETNLHTRLEAFLYQARQFRGKWGAVEEEGR